MYLPSARRKRKSGDKVNLVPILDSVFIFIFFLIFSTSFVKLCEIQSNVPIVSNDEKKEDKDPLALTLQVKSNSIAVLTGVPARLVIEIPSVVPAPTPEQPAPSAQYDLLTLHDELVKIKQAHPDEKSVMLEPVVDLEYEKIVQIMDAVRKLKKTDEALYTKDKSGVEMKVEELFSDIIFANLMG